ncbi:MAG TPA: protein kinase [Anaerolineae bacterium]|nr:protein kinase [Anaerolineae bacterium]
MTNMVGSEIAGYRIIAELGPAVDSGKASHVSQTYKAVAPDGENFVIIKLFPTEVAQNRELLVQLRDSMRGIFRMVHPNIPPIAGSGMHNGRPYIVTPHAAAGNLQDRLDRGTLTALDIERVIMEITSALEYAHSHGILHGNLKPSNILIDEEGHAQVTDLGQASVLGKLRSPGTPPYGGEAYKAPEVIQGAGMTPLSDQYSLGLIALELLTGLPVAEGLLALRDYLKGAPNRSTRGNQLSTQLSPKVVEVLSRAISINPEQRFDSMADLKRAFRTAFGKEASPLVESESSPQQVHTPQRRKRRTFIPLAAAMATILCFAITLPVLSSVWKESNNGSSSGTQLTPTTISVYELETGTLSNQDEGKPTAVNEELPEHDTDKSEPPTEAANQVATRPPATEGTPSGNQPEATATPPPTDILTITAAASSQPTNTLTITPAATPTPTDTQSPSATPTQEPSPTPPSIPTIDPSKCNNKPGHPHYCTPTP